MADPRLKSALEGVYEGFHKGRITAAAATDEWEAQRDRGRAIKEHTIANLDYYLELLAENVEKNGGHVFFARDSAEANKYVLEIVKQKKVRTVIKSKSMVSEEMGLNHALEGAGVEAVETDLGEYIIQLAGETPYHIIAPAIHKSKDEVSDLLAARSGGRRLDRAADLTLQAREQLREVFKRADMSVTGANFAVAESGSIVLVTNEGNGRMATSAPRIHIAAMGMEKVVPSIADLSTFLRILIRSATGQRISSYVTMVNGPRREDDEDGPEEFHLVVIDNNRSKLLADPALREALYCIRCGACMNACPVYRKVGGTQLRVGLPGADRGRDHAGPDRTRLGEGPPVRFNVVRSVQGGVSRQDRSAPHAAGTAGASHGVIRREVRRVDVAGMEDRNYATDDLRRRRPRGEMDVTADYAGQMDQEDAASAWAVDDQQGLPCAGIRVVCVSF